METLYLAVLCKYYPTERNIRRMEVHYGKILLE